MSSLMRGRAGISGGISTITGCVGFCAPGWDYGWALVAAERFAVPQAEPPYPHRGNCRLFARQRVCSRGFQRAHVRGKGDGVTETDWLTDMIAGWVCTWRKYLRQDEVSPLGETLRRHESTGRPLGDESFVKRVGALLRRDLLPKKRGPKGKTKRKANN